MNTAVLIARMVVFLSVMGALGAGSLATTLRALFDEGRARPDVQRRIRIAAWVAWAAIVEMELLARLYAPLGGGAWRYVLGVQRGGALVLWATALLLWGLRWCRFLLGAAWKPLVSALKPTAPALTLPAPDERPTVVPRRVALGALGVGGFAVLRGGLRDRHDLQVHDVTVVLPGLPPSLEGVTLVQLTDLHIGIFTGRQELDQLVRVVGRARGDLVVLTGDIVDNNPAHIAEGMRALGAIRAPLGVYGILGNHDHVAGAGPVVRGLDAVGIRPLVNASVRIAPDRRGSIVLAGVDDLWARRDGVGGPDLAAALRGRVPDGPTVLLAHNPLYFDEVAGHVDLQLSGHTHGGQINPGGIAGARLRYVAGRYTRRGSALFVSRGIGITGPPVRLNAPPEVVRIALTARRA